MVGWLTGWLLGWLVGWLVGWLAGWVGGFVGGRFGGLAGVLVGWGVGWRGLEDPQWLAEDEMEVDLAGINSEKCVHWPHQGLPRMVFGEHWAPKGTPRKPPENKMRNHLVLAGLF